MEEEKAKANQWVAPKERMTLRPSSINHPLKLKLMENTKKIIKNKYSFSSVEHLHTLDGKALTGTSSVTNALAKNLTWWAAELAAVECLEAGARIATIREEYELAAKHPDKKKAIDALQVKYPIFKKARFAHFDSKNKSAKKGTNLHEILQRFCRAEIQRYKLEN